MGWASGVLMLDGIFEMVKEITPSEPTALRAHAAEYLFKLFENSDCDTIGESSHPEIVALYDKKHNVCPKCHRARNASWWCDCDVEEEEDDV